MAQITCNICAWTEEINAPISGFICPQCNGSNHYRKPGNPAGQRVDSKDLLSDKEILNDEFRMIISHRLLGHDLDIEREDWEGMLDSLIDAAFEKLGGT